MTFSDPHRLVISLNELSHFIVNPDCGGGVTQNASSVRALAHFGHHLSVILRFSRTGLRTNANQDFLYPQNPRGPHQHCESWSNLTTQ